MEWNLKRKTEKKYDKKILKFMPNFLCIHLLPTPSSLVLNSLDDYQGLSYKGEAISTENPTHLYQFPIS